MNEVSFCRGKELGCVGIVVNEEEGGEAGVGAVKVLLRNPRREIDVDGVKTVDGLLNRLDLPREAHLVIRNGTLVPGDARLEADDVVRPYSGAVCQYVLLRGDATLDATFSWFDTGTLDREQAVAEERGAEITEKVVQRYPSILARTSVTGTSCSATTSANPGVLSWWVQYRDTQDGDPCADAEKLLAATLSSEM